MHRFRTAGCKKEMLSVGRPGTACAERATRVSRVVPTRRDPFLRQSLSILRHPERCVQSSHLICSAAADGGYFDREKVGSEMIPPQDETPATGDGVSPNQPGDKGEKIPDGQWYPGIIVYAITNVVFIKLFEFSQTCDFQVLLGVLACYYAVAYFLRFLLRRVFNVDEKFPQFFWEGFPQRYKKKE